MMKAGADRIASRSFHRPSHFVSNAKLQSLNADLNPEPCPVPEQAMRVLVAEDHPNLARSIANGLREEGYAVDLTFNGDEALDWALANPYDCLVLDIMLPG